MASPRTWLTRVSVLLILTVAVVACAPPTGAPPPASNSGSPAAQAAPVRIGASISLTGKDARTGKELQQGYLLWQEQVNAKGGILGRQVEFTIYDDTSDPETASKLYEKLISEDKVDLVIGPYSSPVTLPASTVAEKYGYPMIVSGASATDIFTRSYNNVFGLYTAAPFYMDGAIDIAAKNGYKTVGIMNENSAFAKDAMAGAKKKAAEQNMTVVYEEEYGRDVRDLSPILTKMRAANADVLVGGTYGEDATLIVRQLKDMNWVPKIIALTVGPALPDFFQTLGPDANYIYGSTQWEPSIKGPGVSEFVASYKQKYGYEPGYHAGGGFAAGELLKQAAEKAQSFDRDKLRETLKTMQATTVYGAYKVGDNGNQEAKPSYLVQWQNGERKVVWPDSLAEAKYIIPTPDWNAR
jgi:branched-chain amino acid transport system substrate-binding protein